MIQSPDNTSDDQIRWLSPVERTSDIEMTCLSIMRGARSMPTAHQPTEPPDADHAFNRRWFLDYWQDASADCAVAFDENAEPIAYLVARETPPARDRWASDFPYYESFTHLLAHFPAHLHMNCASHARGRGLGSRLLDAVAERLIQRQIPGVHIVTADGARNVGFYERNGFVTRARDQCDKLRLFMARDLAGETDGL